MAQKYILNWLTFTDQLQLMFRELYDLCIGLSSACLT